MIRLFVLLTLAGLAAARAAEPDWNRIEGEALKRLQQYIRIETINPPAEVTKAAAFFESELKQAGLEPKLYVADSKTGKVNLLVRLPGRDRTKKPLLLLNHFDTVPVDRKMWDIDPFGGELKDGSIWGRGALDMKGIGIQHLTALIELKRNGVMPSRDIVMLTTADEESGGLFGIQWMAANHFADIDAEYVLDEGGFGTREILAPGKLVFGIAAGEKQVARLSVRATGTAAHGSQPIPDNANDRLLAALDKIIHYRGLEKVHPIVAEMRRNIGGTFAENKYTNAIQKNTIAITSLRAGVGDPPASNVIPSVAIATVDCRLQPGVNAQEFLSEIKASINDPKVSVEFIQPPVDSGISRYDTPLFAAMTRVIQKHNPGAIVTPILVPHGTDSRTMRMRGIPSYGLTPMILDLATAGTMHSDRERIPIAEFHRGIHVFYDLLVSDF